MQRQVEAPYRVEDPHQQSPPDYQAAKAYSEVPQRDIVELSRLAGSRYHTEVVREPAAEDRQSQTSGGPSFEACKMNNAVYVVAAVVGVIALLLVILLPISFHGVEYYEFGFKKRKTTGSVDLGQVYTTGRHMIGPDYEFKTFSADAHFEHFSRVSVFAADNLQVTITANMQYFLRSHQLHLLHKQFDLHYKEPMKNNALDAIKGAATQYETREYIRDRDRVEKGIFKAVRERLGGKCCEKDCEKEGNCIKYCTPYASCTEDQYGLFAEVRYFQLAGLDIPDDLEEKFLNQLVETQKNAAAKYKQDALLVRKETEQQVKSIENQASEISHNATAQSSLIAAYASANATAIVENARTNGLKLLYEKVKITDPKHKASFDYLRTLKTMSSVHMAVDYQTLMAGPMKP